MFKRLVLTVAVIVGCVNFSGCFLLIPAAIGVAVGGGIAIGTAKWMSDKLVERVPHPMPKTIQAAQDGLKDLSVDIISQTDTPKLTQISAKYTDGRTVWVNVAYVSDSVTEVQVRVGAWGGKDDANKILDKILTHL